MSLCSETLLILNRTPPPSSTHFLLEGCVHIKSKSIHSTFVYFTQSIHIFTSPCFYGNKWVIHSQEVVGCFTVNIYTCPHIGTAHGHTTRMWASQKYTEHRNQCDPILMQLESKLGCPRDVSSPVMVAKQPILVRFLCCLGSGHKKWTHTNFISVHLSLKARPELFVGLI